MHVIIPNYNKIHLILAKYFKMLPIIIKQLVYIGNYKYKQAKSKQRGLVGGGQPPATGSNWLLCLLLAS